MIDGVVYDCTILESLLQSSLKCFCSSLCSQKLIAAMAVNDYIRYSSSGRSAHYFEPLDMSSSSFSINDTVETIVNRMFIESWTSNVSYELFFEVCAPEQCSYTYTFRFDWIDVSTTFLSVFGGLSLGLYFLVPKLMTLTSKIRNRCRIAPR